MKNPKRNPRPQKRETGRPQPQLQQVLHSVSALPRSQAGQHKRAKRDTTAAARSCTPMR